jgi:hypothetical protein
MLSFEGMKNAVKEKGYIIQFVDDEICGRMVLLIKRNSECEISLKRAREWVEVGITDFDCKKKDEMISLIDKWEEESK